MGFCRVPLHALYVILLAWMIILNGLVYSAICVNFQLNRSIISEMFCENRDLPMSQCNGQCYLDKQLNDVPQDGDSDWMDFRSDFHLFTLFSSASGLGQRGFPDGLAHFSAHRECVYWVYCGGLDKPPPAWNFFGV
jgi:hypothetical protein